MDAVPVPGPADHAFDTKIVSPSELTVCHQREGHLYGFVVLRDREGIRTLSPPTVTAGNVAHDPLAYRHLAVQRAIEVATRAQMIDSGHEVVAFRPPHNQ